MDEEELHQQIRRFLKKVGIRSQQEIEQAVRSAVEARTLSAGAPLQARMQLTIPELGLDLVIRDQITLH